MAITNRHVVTFADSATITLTREDGTEDRIADCRVVYQDDLIDLAVVLLPEGAAKGVRRLPLADSVPDDGESVWSAGYPSLFGKPSWQLGKGVVTNRRVVVESLGLPQYAVFTQHSAPIDPGNSGGPLLVGEPTDSASFRVVGINTWMVQGRQSSNFAISLNQLRDGFARIPDPNGADDPTAIVREKANAIVASLNASDWSRFDANRYVSSRLVMHQGWSVFTSMLSRIDAENRKDWVQRFLSGSPEETLRQAVYRVIYETMHKEGEAISLSAVEPLPDVGGEKRFRVKLARGRDIYLIDWHPDSGNWRAIDAGISTNGTIRPQTRPGGVVPGEKKPSEEGKFPGGISVGIGLTSVPTMYGWKPGFCAELGYHFGIGRIGSLGLAAIIDQGASLVEYGEQALLTVVSVEGKVRLGYPISLGSGSLVPFLGGGVRAGLAVGGPDLGTLRISIEGATGMILRLSSGRSVGIFAGPSFATDKGVRLEGIPVAFFILL